VLYLDCALWPVEGTLDKYGLIDVSTPEAQAIYTKYMTVWLELLDENIPNQLVVHDEDKHSFPSLVKFIEGMQEGTNIPCRIYAIDNDLNKYPIAITKLL